MYRIRIDSPKVGFLGYLRVCNRISWKSKGVALKHLNDYIAKAPDGYLVTLETY